MEPPDSIESIYWVFTHRCNLRCAHCYNFSRPEGPTISRAEADAVLDHLPEHANRYILSGGEPLVELDLLLYLLRRGRARYPEARVSIQTNGDLLDDRTLELLLETGIHHIAIASADQYHPRPDGKFEALRERFERFAMPEVTIGDPGAQSKPRPPGPSFSVWGATPPSSTPSRISARSGPARSGSSRAGSPRRRSQFSSPPPTRAARARWSPWGTSRRSRSPACSRGTAATRFGRR